MYIAFKWLTALAIAMWLGLCCVDILCLKESRTIRLDFPVKPHEVVFEYNNVSVLMNKKHDAIKIVNWKYVKQHYKQHSIAVLHYVMFLAGAFAVAVFNKKNAIIRFAKHRLLKINMTFCEINLFQYNFGATATYFKQLVTSASVAIFNYVNILWGNVKNNILNVPTVRNSNVLKTNSSLLIRVQEIERKGTLGEQLLAAVDENKNIRVQYQLEKNAKDKLIRYIDNIKKLIKENRTQYVSIQQLYLVTHRENVFLKCHLKKLADEKEAAEKNLMALIHQVYRTKNVALKAYCTRFLVHTKKNLLNSDVEVEIRKFLRRSQETSFGTFAKQCNTELDIRLPATSSLPDCSSHVTEVLQDDGNLVSVVCNAPNLIGLPGEYVFTLRDKNGIIKKIYEYKYDFCNGETSGMRQYSVFHDKDCMLDQNNELPTKSICTRMSASKTRLFDLTQLKNQRFLTGSEEFKIFLRNSSVSSTPKIQAPPLPCG